MASQRISPKARPVWTYPQRHQRATNIKDVNDIYIYIMIMSILVYIYVYTYVYCIYVYGILYVYDMI